MIFYCEHCLSKLKTVDGELKCLKCGLTYGQIVGKGVKK